jgi:hypothetical protein
MLCSPRLLGYILQEKMWAQFLVDGIEEIDEDGSQTAFNDRLVLPEESGLDRKTVLMGLVKSHYAAYSDNLYQLEDIVPGKGKGLIILLYGKSWIKRRRQIYTKLSRPPWRWENLHR